MELTVVRHGETDYNAQGRYAGSTDVPLNDRGFEQAEKLAAMLSGERFDLVACSPLLRARQTAEAIRARHGAVRILIEPAFAERHMGVYEGLTRDEAKARYPEMWARPASREPDDGPDGAETIRACDARVAAGLKKVYRQCPEGRVLLVCHGFVARIVNRHALGLSFEDMHGFTLGNCETARYTFCLASSVS